MNEASCKFCRALEHYHLLREKRVADIGSGLLIADLPSSVAVLSVDQYYRGYTIVIAKRHATELFHLDDADSAEFLGDMQRVAKAMAETLAPRKLNYELLGNTVPHLHWHLVPRYDWDPNPKRPIWEHQHQEVMLETREYEQLAAAIRSRL